MNAGNANAFTGEQGLFACENKARVLSSLFQCDTKNIFFSSTGVIGEQLPYNDIIRHFDLLKKLSDKHIRAASNAILTTDLEPKTYTRKFKFDNKFFLYRLLQKDQG